MEVEEFAIEDPESGIPRYLKLVVHPHTDRTDSSEAQDRVMIVVDEITALGRERDELKQLVEQQAAELRRHDSLNQRLTGRNRQLESGNGDLNRINEELRAKNEELSISAEEAQAATEEVETLNEELQATNEEVETLNEELQATIEELNTTTDDQTAHNRELQGHARDGNRRWTWLSFVLENLGLALIIVDGEGGTLLRNSIYEGMFEGQDFEPLDTEGRPLPAEESPRALAACGEPFVTGFLLVSEDGGYRR